MPTSPSNSCDQKNVDSGAIGESQDKLLFPFLCVSLANAYLLRGFLSLLFKGCILGSHSLVPGPRFPTSWWVAEISESSLLKRSSKGSCEIVRSVNGTITKVKGPYLSERVVIRAPLLIPMLKRGRKMGTPTNEKLPLCTPYSHLQLPFSKVIQR